MYVDVRLWPTNITLNSYRCHRGAQEERILILRRALVQKGVISESTSHYDVLSPHPQTQASPPAAANRDAPPTQTGEEEEGIIL